LAKKLGVGLGGRATLTASSQDEDRWRAAQEGAHSGVGSVAGHFSKSARNGAPGTKVTDEGFSYTARGEVSDVYQWSTNSNGYYHTNAMYFANGALNTLSGVPGSSGSPWTYSLDGKGRPYSAIQSASTNMVSSTTYNAADEPCVVTLGLGDTDTYVYDNNTTCNSSLVTGRMTGYTFSIGATPQTFAGSLSWNANGTLRGLTTVDGINSGSETEACAYGTSTSAGYDEFGRLLQVNCVNGSTNVWNQTFAYDIYNNITKSVPSGGTGITWAPGYSATNNQYTLAGTTYDSNGNLLTDTFHTYTWNQDNHPKAMTDAGITMIYDAFGRMIEKATGTTYQQTLISPVGPVALMSKQNPTQWRMPLPGGDLAVTGVNFYHRDYIGSVPLVSSRGMRASVVARLFAPYGEAYNNVGITGDVNFTGDNQDLVPGTYDTPSRELNPSQGRWISPDLAHSSWNAYQYSTNPLGEIDPSGLWDIAGGYGEGTASRDAEQLDGFSTDYVAIFNSLDTTSFNGQEPTVYYWVPSSSALFQNFDSHQDPILDADGNPTYTMKDIPGYWHPIDSSLSSSDTIGPDPGTQQNQPQKKQKSDARVRCDNGLLVKTAFAGLASAKASVVNTADYALDQLHELFSSKSFQAGAGASVAGTLTATGATDVVATTAGAAVSEVLIPLALAGFTGYTVYEGYEGARDYWNEHQNECNNIP
jgi:RHS repeat-associated protein